MIYTNNEIIEGLKELARTALMAVIPLVIVDLQSNTFHWQTWLIAGVIAVLSGIDKWLHKREQEEPKKDRNEGWLGVKGLTGV